MGILGLISVSIGPRGGAARHRVLACALVLLASFASGCQGWTAPPADLASLLLAEPTAAPDPPLVEPERVELDPTTPAEAITSRVAWLNPSNDRDWSPDQAVLARVEFRDSLALVQNIRHCEYRSADDYTVRHYDKTFDLDRLLSVDFIVVPFSDMPAGAHTFLSFGFEGGDYLAVSVEIRKEQGEAYQAVKGVLRQYELMYVVGDERDLIGLRAIHRLDDVHVYRIRAPRQRVRALFLDVMDRVNQLADTPEFYNTVTNNCTTNLLRHVNRIAERPIPYSYQVLLPGFSDRLAFDLGLIDSDRSFEQTRLAARVNAKAYEFRDAPEFSRKIRGE